MTPLVSIIIPVYNAEKHLAETIQSALDQTWPDKEIIIVDDGSADDSLLVAGQFNNKLIRTYKQENKGASSARNFGLREAKGEYIQFLDADDLISKNKIESQLTQLIHHPDHIGLCGTIHFQDGTDPSTYTVQHEWFSEGSDDPADFLIKLYGGGHIGPQYGGMLAVHSWLSPKNILEQAGPWNEELSLDDDGEYFCRVLLASKGVVYAPQAIAYYRKFTVSNNLSAQKNYKTSLSALRSNQLKAKYLLASTNNFKAKIALSRLLWDNAFTFYPGYKKLSSEAEKKAKALDPDYQFQPFQKGIKRVLSKLFGWKVTRYFQFLKSQIG
jgi:glycosyltransferase involved in cell wall biosynthesis